ncbi:MAG: hypothetical protein OEM92_09515 [Gammaproteobacteria bacterium]|nr:hypothetical protein [Gammaproteobacteria bacterium]
MNTNKLSAIAKSRIGRPPTKVFSAFADAHEMRKFWFTRRDDGLKKGGSVSWFVGDRDDAIVEQALDSAGGFSQAIIADHV